MTDLRSTPRTRRTTRASLLGTALTAVLMSAGGCAGTPSGASEFHRGGVVFDVQWRVETPGRQDFQLRPRQLGGTAYDAANDRVVVTTAAGRLQSYRALDGTRMWEHRFGFPADSVPTVVDGVIYAGFGDGSVRAWNAASGAELWTFHAGTIFQGAPLVAHGLVYLQGTDSRLYALDATTGAQRWTFERPRPADLTLYGQATPTALADGIVTGFDDGSLVRLDRSGQLVWIADLAAGQRRMTDIDSSPLVIGDRVYATSFSGGLHALELETGTVLWRSAVVGATNAVSGDGTVLVATDDNELIAHEPVDGTVHWRMQLPGTTPMSLAPYGRFVLVTMREGGVMVVDSARPYLHGQFDPDSGFHALPSLAAGRFFAISDKGYLYAVGLHAL